MSSATLATFQKKTAATLIICTAIMLLVWAFGSYLLYVLYAPAPKMCIPFISGCASISLTGMSEISGVFYRATILPVAPFVGLSFLLGLRFLAHIKPGLSRGAQELLFVTGVILCPLFLIIAEAMLNGTFHIPSLQAHVIFSKLAFLMPIIFQLIYSFQLLTIDKSARTKLMCILAIISVPCYLFMVTHIIPVAHFSTIMEWDLFIVLNIWIILMGACVKKQSV